MSNSANEWSQRDFQQWLKQSEDLGPLGRVVFVANAAPLTKAVDSTCLMAQDNKAILTLVEVKNETAIRKIIGQIFDYLAGQSDATLESVAEQCDDVPDGHGDRAGVLVGRFHHAFGSKPNTLSDQRRVVLVAKNFDSATTVTAHYLSEILQGKITFYLVRATRTPTGFSLSEIKPDWRSASAMQGSFGLTESRTLVYVVEGGQHPVLWRIGKLDSDGQLKRLMDSKRTLIQGHKRLQPLPEKPPFVRIDKHGSRFELVDPKAHAFVLGEGRIGERWQLVRVRCDDGSATYVQKRASMSAKWKPTRSQKPDWRLLASQLSQSR